MVVVADEQGRTKRTGKFLQALTYGAYIVSLDWVKACLGAGRKEDEQAFEVVGDRGGTVEGLPLGTAGPRRAREAREQQGGGGSAPALLAGHEIYLSGQFHVSPP